MKSIKKIYGNLLQATHAAKRLLIAFLILILGAVTAFTISVNTASAGPGDPFGGMIISVLTCTCSGNFAVYFNDLTITSTTGGLPLIYQPGATIVYEFGPPLRSGIWMLGTWQTGGQCLVFAGKGCMTIPTAGTMYMVGTSQ